MDRPHAREDRKDRSVELVFERRPSALAYMVRGAWPTERTATRAPELSARWSGHRVGARDLAAFHAITGLPSGPTLHPLHPLVFGFRLVMAVLTHPSFPVAIWGVLQTRNHLVQHRPIPVAARLDLETRVIGMRVLERGAELDLHTTVRVEGELAWESLLTFYARGRFGEPGAPSPLARAPSVVGAEVAAWTMRDDGHLRFGRLTGDYNGIHLWDAYARRFGFARALYHPARVLGEAFARLPAVDVEAPQRLDLWLKGPVSHGATVRLHAAFEPACTTFAVFADGDRPSIVGRHRTGADLSPFLSDAEPPSSPAP